MEEAMELVEPPTWNLFVDGLAGDTGSGAGVVLVSPEVRDKIIASYLKMVMNLLPSFEKFEIMQIPSLENAHADALSKLASNKDSKLLTILPIEHLLTPSTEATEVLSTDKDETYKLRKRSAHFLFIDEVLYKRSFSSPLLRCVGGDEVSYILREIHEGVYDNHSGGLALAQKRRRELCHVAIDYFTKWVEAEPLAKITEAKTSKFFWKNIICRFKIPHSIVSDNGRQFDNKKVRNLGEELGIRKHFLTPRHPQANGQVEAVNKMIKHVLERKLDASKGAWVDKLPQVLWAIRTTARTLAGETPFLMAYGTEAMSPVKVGLPSPRRLHFSEISNDELLRFNLDFIDERTDDSQLRLAAYQRKMTKYFNSKVKKRFFQINDLVFRRVFLSSKGPGEGTMGPN
ncbi:uncharacterized protein LOC111374102 [Olea europaea var. sylvestris]|uniref:uncharacterized protein LOC111374102 n=1 Tax=Olea europaea var. sylvestris TaxID=158386 RepID=UPI000C1D1DBF|nr:uncharacterized protein LOC111374102 [Olea europaea var. sylvestris]